MNKLSTVYHTKTFYIPTDYSSVNTKMMKHETNLETMTSVKANQKVFYLTNTRWGSEMGNFKSNDKSTFKSIYWIKN